MSDSGVDAGSNASNESICMSLASSVSDFDNEDIIVLRDFDDNNNNNDIRVIEVDINRVNPNPNANNSDDSTDNSAQNDFGRNSCQMLDSSYMPSSSLSTMSSMASTSSAATASPSLPSIGSHCHYESLCSTSTSGHNRMSNSFGDHFEHHFFEETKPESSSDLISVPKDYYYSCEEQHEYYPKMRANRQKSHEMKPKHIFRDIAGERMLRRAANSNDIECVRKLLNEGIDPQSSDERNRTALHFAACKGNTQIGRLLLEKGADPNQKDAIGNTALHLAACTNNIGVITLLLSAGTDINSLDNSGRTPLHLAQSKLKMIQSMQRSDLSINSDQLKSEVLQVLQMMSIYWHRSGKSAELELLTTFTNRLHLSQTSEEVGTDVKDLLTSLSHLTL